MAIGSIVSAGAGIISGLGGIFGGDQPGEGGFCANSNQRELEQAYAQANSAETREARRIWSRYWERSFPGMTGVKALAWYAVGSTTCAPSSDNERRFMQEIQDLAQRIVNRIQQESATRTTRSQTQDGRVPTGFINVGGTVIPVFDDTGQIQPGDTGSRDATEREPQAAGFGGMGAFVAVGLAAVALFFVLNQ